MNSFREGAKLRIKSQDGDVHEYVICSGNSQVYVLQSLIVASRKIKLSYEELKELLENQYLEFIKKTNDEEKEALKEDLQLFDEKEIDDTIRKRAYIDKLIEEGVTVWSPKHIEPLLNKVAEDIGDKKPPKWRTIIRWHKAYSKEAYSLRGLYSNNYKKGNYKKRLSEEVERYLKKSLEHYKTEERVSAKDAYEKLEEYIFTDNKFRHRDDELSTPSYTTFLKRLHKEPPKEIMAGRQGSAKADIEYDHISQAIPTTRILERVALDHTQLDLFVLDKKLRLPLGRPWLTIAVDEYSRSIIGLYISFSHPSAKVVMKLLAQSINSKKYINEKYPNIKNKWICYGKAALYIFDNGKEFWSKDINIVLAELGADHAFNPVKKPWFKSKAERRFGTINKRHLEKLKGKTFNSIKEREGYDPKKNAVIFFDTLIEITYQWVIDEFQVSPHGDENIIPDILWEESEKEYPPVTVEPERLEIIMNATHESKLRRGGLYYDYIRYDSEELARYRSIVGSCKTKYKVNEDNLSYIYVFNKNTRKYFKVYAVDQAYTCSLRQCQHDAHKKHARLLTNNNVNYEAIVQARIDTSRRVNDDITSLLENPKSISISDLSALSKYTGVEQEGNTSVLDGIDTKNTKPTPPDVSKRSVDDPSFSDYALISKDEDDDLDTTGWSTS
ncbi:hypothetical protein [Endozoicomonas sp. ALD040]|uniref:hypothetical protein n=1 Tax=Endozoicomonas sp. ALD040 TaxID=3403079 RepID=UPI003BAF07BD